MYVASIIHSNFVQYRDNIFLSFVVEILTGKTGISSTPEPGEIASVSSSCACKETILHSPAMHASARPVADTGLSKAGHLHI